MIFIDLGVFIAFYNRRDENHERSKELISSIARHEYGQGITSDYVFDEVITTVHARTKRPDFAMKIGKLILGRFEGIPQFIKIYFVSKEIFFDAWEIYLQYSGKGLSFTDATIISMINAHKINYLASFDSGFDGILTRIY